MKAWVGGVALAVALGSGALAQEMAELVEEFGRGKG